MDVSGDRFGFVWQANRVYHLTMADQPNLADILFSEEGASIQEAMETVELKDGEVLFQRGDPGDAFYVVESGKVRIFTEDEEGREITLNTLGEGDPFGELALVDDRPRSASVGADGPATLRRLSRADFLSLIHTSPELTNVVIGLLSERTRHMTDYIERLGHWARLVAEGKYNKAMKGIRSQEGIEDRALMAVADAVENMVKAVKEREQQLKQEVAQLRIEIDQSKRKRQVDEITETDYFQNLTQQARSLREQSKDET